MKSLHKLQGILIFFMVGNQKLKEERHVCQCTQLTKMLLISARNNQKGNNGLQLKGNECKGVEVKTGSNIIIQEHLYSRRLLRRSGAMTFSVAGCRENPLQLLQLDFFVVKFKNSYGALHLVSNVTTERTHGLKRLQYRCQITNLTQRIEEDRSHWLAFSFI